MEKIEISKGGSLTPVIAATPSNSPRATSRPVAVPEEYGQGEEAVNQCRKQKAADEHGYNYVL